MRVWKIIFQHYSMLLPFCFWFFFQLASSSLFSSYFTLFNCVYLANSWNTEKNTISVWLCLASCLDLCSVFVFFSVVEFFHHQKKKSQTGQWPINFHHLVRLFVYKYVCVWLFNFIATNFCDLKSSSSIYYLFFNHHELLFSSVSNKILWNWQQINQIHHNQ